jgi:hypothetical protein
MATRSPTQTHSYWGEFANTGALPGVGSAAPTLQAGDTAFVSPSLYVCTSATFPATWAAVGDGGITQLTLDVLAGPGSGSQVATVQGMGGATTKTHFVIEGGKFATLQAAVTAAAANDVIMVGPKATGDWGNVLLNVVNKPLIIAAMSGAGSNKIVKIGSVTYDLGTTGPALNANLNETYLYGLSIQGAFAGGSAVTLTGGANYPGRLRLYGCYVLNTSATGTAAVTNSNQGTSSSLYLDSCVVSLTPSAAGSTIVQTAGYTLIRNRSDVSGSLAAGATGSAIKVSAGTVEILDSSISIDRAANTSSTIDIPAGSSASTFVSAGYSTISNNSDAAGSACVNIGTAGATFGAGDATLASGASVAAAGSVVQGVGGGRFLYANVSFSYRTAVTGISPATTIATAQSGGLFSYGMSVGSIFGTTFAVNSTGNFTKINNVTTSFPSAQGTAGQVLANDGAGTLSWATRVTSVTATSPITSSGGTTPVIALGTVTVAKGGTNLTATPTNGQLLIGNGTGYTLATLTQGSGITITNASGAVTIAATAVAAPISTALNGSASVATFIGAVYVPAGITLAATSRAFIGTSNSGTVTLTLQTLGLVDAATFTSGTITGFDDVLVIGTPTLAAGWYNLVLTPGVGVTTAFARGLYLV